MEVKKLATFAFAIVIIGMIVGVGVLTLDKLSSASWDKRTTTNEGLVWVDSGSNISLAANNLTEVVSLVNSSNIAVATTNYTVFLTDGKIQVDDTNGSACLTGVPCYITYKWENANTAAATAFNASRDAVSAISTTWLALIVTIGVLAVLLFMIISSFGKRR